MSSQFRLPNDFPLRIIAAVRIHLRASKDAYIPDVEHLAEALDVAFWASLITDESRQSIFTISLSPQVSASRVLALQDPKPLGPELLAKFAMATTPDISAVHVGPGDQGLKIFGIDTLLGTAAPVRIDVRGPATLAVKSADATVAIVSGARAELVDLTLYAQYWFIDGEFPRQFDETSKRDYRIHDVVKAMCAHGHGGTILILPDANVASKDSCIEVLYPLEPHFDGLRLVDESVNEAAKARALAKQVTDVRHASSELRIALTLRDRYVSAIGRTTAVDGAMVLSSDGLLLGFGAKIRLSEKNPRVRRLRVTEKHQAAIVALQEFGGTRHQSAARFAASCPGSRAVVASQDGMLSILEYVTEDDVVDCLEHAEWLF